MLFLGNQLSYQTEQLQYYMQTMGTYEPDAPAFGVKPTVRREDIGKKIRNGAVIHPVSAQIEIFVAQVNSP